MTAIEKYIEGKAQRIALERMAQGRDASPECCLLAYMTEMKYAPEMIEPACAAMLPWFIRAIEPMAAV